MHRHVTHGAHWRPVVLVLALVVGLAACTSAVATSGSATRAGLGPATALRLGFFPNITHATALVGVGRGTFAAKLGPSVSLSTKTFNAGPAAVEALFSGAIDAAYVGPNPAINAFVKSHGSAVRIISGATSGGAALIVRKGITRAQALRGKKIATPQLGNTQDVALRWWLSRNGLHATKEGAGDVTVVPQENAQTLTTFQAGQIDGAWVPEPWATRLVQAGGVVLVDERALWPAGRFVTTQLIVRTDYLREHADIVRRLLEGQVAADAWIDANPGDAQRVVRDQLAKITGKALDPGIIAAAWKNLTFTNDPVASSLRADADHAHGVGLLDRVDLDGIYDLRLLNEVLVAAGEPKVAS